MIDQDANKFLEVFFFFTRNYLVPYRDWMKYDCNEFFPADLQVLRIEDGSDRV